MNNFSFYSAILGLSSSWHIFNVTLDGRSGDVVFHIRGRLEDKFKCPGCGAARLPSGISKGTWLHDNHLNIRFYISALVPVITCECCGEMKVEIPWGKSSTSCEECSQMVSRSAV
ncbi:MAG: hypothetical protein GJV46_05345 [Geobacter sp.]|nr:hypothetical protein [Geobacter sp.]